MIASINENNFVNSKYDLKSHKPESFSFIIDELNNLVKKNNYPIIRNGKFFSWRAVLFVMSNDYVEQTILFDAKGHNAKFFCIMDNIQKRRVKLSIQVRFFFKFFNY